MYFNLSSCTLQNFHGRDFGWMWSEERPKIQCGVKFNYIIHCSWRLSYPLSVRDLKTPLWCPFAVLDDPQMRRTRAYKPPGYAYRFTGCHRNHCLLELDWNSRPLCCFSPLRPQRFSRSKSVFHLRLFPNRNVDPRTRRCVSCIKGIVCRWSFSKLLSDPLPFSVEFLDNRVV